MFLFSTVLFIDGNPIGYKVFKEEGNQISLHPAEHPSRSITPPVITVISEADNLQINGTDNAELIKQIKEDLVQNLKLPSYNLSAAP